MGMPSPYFRVSTDRQGKSGLGLDAQREAVMDYLNGGRWTLVDEFTEIESGKRNDRPELEKAPAACKRLKAKLVIAKLDRHQACSSSGEAGTRPPR
jgi:DNA invertase Pin-like site-specific DNA recombinase